MHTTAVLLVHMVRKCCDSFCQERALPGTEKTKAAIMAALLVRNTVRFKLLLTD